MFKNKKVIIVLLLVLVAAIATTLVVSGLRNKADKPVLVDTVSNRPATKNEKSESESHKEDLVKQSQQEKTAANNSSQEKKSVKPVITFWGQSAAGSDFEIGGYAPGVIEDGGNCTVTLTKDGRSASGSSAGKKDASTTSCGSMVVKRSSLSPGTWSAVLSYDSPAANGTSEAVKVEVK